MGMQNQQAITEVSHSERGTKNKIAVSCNIVGSDYRGKDLLCISVWLRDIDCTTWLPSYHRLQRKESDQMIIIAGLGA